MDFIKGGYTPLGYMSIGYRALGHRALNDEAYPSWQWVAELSDTWLLLTIVSDIGVSATWPLVPILWVTRLWEI